mmetsp:Transcript_31705/g.36043  ORF Transcript_31705/g.36043 Transcript_31705/m.36043 type:complete len:522 (-) Transcript_31705:200-1765(-)
MVTIGRLPVNSLVINEKRISGCHCRIIKQTNEREETVVVIEDLSSNGTFVNDEKVGKGSSKVLKNGDEIMLLQKQRVGPADMTGFILAIHEGEVDAPRKRSRREKDDIELEKDHEEAIRRLKLGDSVEEEKKTEAPKTDKLKESVSEELTCGICIDILYQCVTLIPCFHSFCGCCFSDYLLKKKDCPQCREEVTEVRRNPTINNLAESYLESHPEEKRTEEEYKAMRDGNRLTVDRLKISDLTRTSKANTEERRKLAVSRPEGSGVVSSSSGSGAGRDEGKKSALERKRTRKSPGFESDGSAPSDHGEDDDTSESSEDDREPVRCRQCRRAGPGGFKCSSNGYRHINCSACNIPFPNRTGFPIRCNLCRKPFCNQYWKCSNTSTRRERLQKLGDWRLGDIPATCFNGNIFERNTTMDYINGHRKRVVDIWRDMVEKMEKSTWRFASGTTVLQPPTKENFCCTRCVKNIWCELLYKYRESIQDELPDKIKKRPDCWYGQYCRTQTHNLDHATNYNHICDAKK